MQGRDESPDPRLKPRETQVFRETQDKEAEAGAKSSGEWRKPTWFVNCTESLQEGSAPSRERNSMGSFLGSGCYINSTLSNKSRLVVKPRRAGSGAVSVIDNSSRPRKCWRGTRTLVRHTYLSTGLSGIKQHMPLFWQFHDILF